MPLEVFGGLVSDLAPTDLPLGSSPDNQDVAFQIGLVRTRPGLQNVFPAIAGNPTINYLKTYITPTQILRMLTLDSNGVVYRENPIGTLQQIGTVEGGEYCRSCSQFSREYMAFSDSKFGLDIPRQYDDTNFDRVSQVGPGAAPGAADETASFTIAAGPGGAQMSTPNVIIAGPNGATESGFLVTINCGQLPAGTVVGDLVKVAGVGVAGYNGTWTITAIPSATTFQYINTVSGLAASGGGTADFGYAQYNTTTATNFVAGQLITIAGVAVGGYNVTGNIRFLSSPTLFFLKLGVFGLANSGGGTASASGNITTGVRGVSVMFKTRQGYITAPAPPGSWTSGGGKRVVLTNIPIGPSNVVARIIIFTLAGGQSYYYLTGIPQQIFSSNFIINDNTTTTATFDFTDAILAAGVSADYLFRLVELGECSGTIDYASRIFWWGERNKVENFVNLTFDGGSSGGAFDIPLGWSLDPGFISGSAMSTIAVWGSSWLINGDGVTAIRGRITQPAFQDINGVAIIQPNVAYSARVRLQQVGVTQGNFIIELFSPSAGSLGLFSTVISTMPTGSFGESIGVLMTAQSTIPPDTLLRIYANGTMNAASIVYIDNIEIFPTNQPFNTSLVRVSRVEDPESFDGVNGIMQYGEGDGTRVTAAFKLRDNLYFLKERSLWQTKDDGVNEPAKWAVNQISSIFGTPSVNGVGIGSDWVVIATRLGLYFFDGAEPEKISQEIQKPVVSASGQLLAGWDNINWQFASTIWCQVDEKNRRVLVGAPVFNSTTPNIVFVLDYRGLDTGRDIAAHKSIHISAYTGKIYDIADSRKWTRWNISAASANQIERPDGTFHLFVGNAAGTGKIYDLLDVENFANPAQFGDDGAAINSYYDTYFFIRPAEEEQYQLGSHRKLYRYLTLYIEGQGGWSLTAFPPGNFPGIPIPQSGNALPLLINPTSPIGIASISRTLGVVTVTTLTPHNLASTTNVVINGTGVFDGLFGNLTIINTTVFKFSAPGADVAPILNTGNMNPLIRDTELPINILTERCKLRVSTDAVGSWFSLRTMTPSIMTDPWAPVRGIN